jgi:GNAT superfamily N-acetyltransferase
MPRDHETVTDVSNEIIRIATVADVKALARLRYQWRVGERGERGLDEPSFEQALASWMKGHESTHIAFLATTAGELPIGMAWLAIVDRVPGPGRFTRRSGYIQSTYVVATNRGYGTGTRIVRHLLDHAAGLDLDYVAVHPSERSFSLYQRLGFSATDRVLELRRR